MIYLVLTVLSSALVSIFMRLSSDKVRNNISLLAVNYVTCLVVAAADDGWKLIPEGEGVGTTLLMGIVHGTLYLTSFWLLQRNVIRNGVVLSATFMKLGLLVPMVVSLVLFREKPGLLQVLGFGLALLAIMLVNGDGKKENVSSRSGLLLLLLAGGGGDAMAKIFEEWGSNAHAPQFLIYTFGAALLLCILLAFSKGQKIGMPELVYGALIGVPNFLSARFLLRALDAVPAVIVYPSCSVGAILIVTLAGLLLFGERLQKRQWFAMALIAVSLFFLNV